jgi:hypothetical protein
VQPEQMPQAVTVTGDAELMRGGDGRVHVLITVVCGAVKQQIIVPASDADRFMAGWSVKVHEMVEAARRANTGIVVPTAPLPPANGRGLLPGR